MLRTGLNFSAPITATLIRSAASTTPSAGNRDPDEYTVHHGSGGVTMRATYLGDLRTELRHPQSGASIVTDAPVDNQGKGAAFSPTDLVGSALAGCFMTILGIRFKALGVPLGERSLVVQVTKHMTKEGPRRIDQLPITAFVNVDLDEKKKESVIRAARECPVKKSLHPSIRIPAAFVWADGTVTRTDLTKDN